MTTTKPTPMNPDYYLELMLAYELSVKSGHHHMAQAYRTLIVREWAKGAQ